MDEEVSQFWKLECVHSQGAQMRKCNDVPSIVLSGQIRPHFLTVTCKKESVTMN